MPTENVGIYPHFPEGKCSDDTEVV